MRYLFLAAITLSACGTDTGDTGTVITPDPVAGADVYSANCVVCHGPDGTAGISGAADLTVKVPTLTDDEIANVVLNGEATADFAMAPIALSDQEMADLLAYLRQTFL
jgi:mono/diheme cytochrome c family protein